MDEESCRGVGQVWDLYEGKKGLADGLKGKGQRQKRVEEGYEGWESGLQEYDNEQKKTKM